MKNMGRIGRISLRIATVLISFILLMWITGNNHIFKAIGNTYLVGITGPSIDEYDIFEYNTVTSEKYVQIPYHYSYNAVEGNDSLFNEIEQYDPASFLVLRKNAFIYEKYWDQYYENSLTNSFSVAKSIVGLCVGIAVDKGIIESLDQKVIEYIPELEGEYREAVTIRHLLSMTSGINFDESYGNPFGFMAKAYYGDELTKRTLSYEADEPPGTEWKYLGGNTILLSLIVKRASGKTMSDFVSKHIWNPLGAESDAYWNIDQKGGIEKAYCCFYTTTRDFARIGRIVLENGFVNQQYIVSPEFLNELKNPVFLKDGSVVEHYGLHWWRVKYKGQIITYARGIRGQYIICIPDMEMVVVRTGHSRGKKREDQHPEDLFVYVDFAMSLLGSFNPDEI